jgi:hypothetical protein
MKADPADMDPEATPDGASALSDRCMQTEEERLAGSHNPNGKLSPRDDQKR